MSPLRDNGGTTPTHALRPNSTAINPASSNGAPTSDQRGAPRLGSADIGAFEFLPIVTNANDAGAGSIRQTVADVPAGGFVLFDDFFRTQARTIALPTGQITIDKSLSIIGTGANVLTVQNTQAPSSTSRVFLINGTVNLSGMTITSGNVDGAGGGMNTDGTVILNNVNITGNKAGLYGGGTITAGNNKVLINVQFTVANNAAAGQTPISFTDTPTFREVASAPGAANGVQALPATFTSGLLTITTTGKSRKRARFF